jgi:8-oxo-dGTP pyrophosphatase MutT (NUDIX family)
MAGGRPRPDALIKGCIQDLVNLKLKYDADVDDAEVPPAVPAATLVLLRDAAAGLEVLLLRRSRQLTAFAGVWVFPGGATEPADGPADDWPACQTTARHTAVRELAEETGLVLGPEALRPLSRWTAPVGMPRRFDTWFFLAVSPEMPVRIDRGEIHDHRWIEPRKALAHHHSGHMPFFPPTWVTLHHLASFDRCDTALSSAARTPSYHFAPKVVPRGAGTCFLYSGDLAYDQLAIDAPGPRHRLWVRRDGWQYECTLDSGGPYGPSEA